MTTQRIDEIVVGERHPRDLGDINALARSEADLGSLQPIVIRPGRLATLPFRKLKGDAPEALDTESPASAGRVGRFCRGAAS
jgi:hypothetical protein